MSEININTKLLVQLNRDIQRGKYLDGTQYILLAMIHFYSENDHSRSIEEKYNIIISALMGDDAGNFKIGPESKRARSLKLSKALLAMHEAEKIKTYRTKKSLAQEFVETVPYIGTPENAVINLRNEYTQICKVYKKDADWQNLRNYIYEQELYLNGEDTADVKEFIRQYLGAIDDWKYAFDLYEPPEDEED